MAATARIGWCALAMMVGHAIGQPGWAEETCRYSGTTSYSGRVNVETKAAARGGEVTVDVAARVNARSFGLVDWQYLYQEIGTWRGGELRSIGVNHRYSIAGSIRRQQWDVFNRTPAGMTAFRVQANTLAEFQARHPGFVRHWDPATFGEPWLPGYATASPERRADLDLPMGSMPVGLGTPLLMAFYWVRWADPHEQMVPLFLPGFKRDATADIKVVPLGVDAGGLLHLHSVVRHPQLSGTKVSTGDAWVSSDHRLVRVGFDARGDHGSVQGELRLVGCQGEPPVP